MKKIIAINAGPRKGWNTDSLVAEAARGAESAGAEVEYIDLFKLEKYTGCISCFACKREASWGVCACRDGLTDVLAKIRQADGLIIGSPNYLGNMTASFRALYERLVFQNLTYNVETPCCNEHPIPVLLIHTSNCEEEFYDQAGITAMLAGYEGTLNTFVGPTKVLACGGTQQVPDYSKFNWTFFNAEERYARHSETFDSYKERAFQMGAEL